jgi:hypothetical protein
LKEKVEKHVTWAEIVREGQSKTRKAEKPIVVTKDELADRYGKSEEVDNDRGLPGPKGT